MKLKNPKGRIRRCSCRNPVAGKETSHVACFVKQVLRWIISAKSKHPNRRIRRYSSIFLVVFDEIQPGPSGKAIHYHQSNKTVKKTTAETISTNSETPPSYSINLSIEKINSKPSFSTVIVRKKCINYPYAAYFNQNLYFHHLLPVETSHPSVTRFAGSERTRLAGGGW